MKKIEKYNLPENTNKLYKEEASSSIGLTHEIAKKINELIDAYNTLAKEDLEWKQTQEGTIRKGVLYMKDNLLNSLNDLMVMLRDSGFIDDRIEYHCEDLKDRLNNLLGTIKEGSTTMDAELIDLRLDKNGGTHANAGLAIRRMFTHETYTADGKIDSSNYKELLPDLNEVKDPCTLILNFNYNTTDLPLNMPYDVFKGRVDLFINAFDQMARQVIISDDYIYTRAGYYVNDVLTFEDWKKIYDRLEEATSKTKVYKAVNLVTSANYQEVLPDANGILENSTYQLNFNYSETDLTANLPYNRFTGRIDELITFCDHYYRQLLVSDKYIYTRNGILNTSGSVDYSDWVLIWSLENMTAKKIVVDKNGGGNYTSLTKCMFDNQTSKCEIIVKSGVYDLIDEFKEYFGEEVFTGTTLSYNGLPVKNCTKVLLDAGVEVTFNYDGSNSVVEEYFSPFVMINDGGEIHGGKITCTNCRYAIHDDVYAGSENSKSVIDGVVINYNSERNVGIGGGFGQSSDITVKNCIIKNGRTNEIGYGIFYHNSATGNSKSIVKIENNIVTDKIVIEPYGTSTNISNAIISNNKCIDVVKVQGGEIDNIELYEFNNIKG